MTIIITVAFCPAAQLARTLMEYGNYGFFTENRTLRHIVVDGYYPINRKSNLRDLKLITESFGRAEFWDPGSDLGSAQSQNWVLAQLKDDLKDDDTWINLDPDAACRTYHWDYAMTEVMNGDEKCAVISCHSPMVQGFIERRHQKMEEKEVAGHTILLPDMPTPFNLSMWRIGFLNEIGGIPQKFPFYGEVEGPMYAMSRALGYWTGYLKNYMEDEQGKLMHDEVFEEWKELHARRCEFMGSFKEYCLEKGILQHEEKS